MLLMILIIVSTLCLLLSVAYWTLFERKMLAGMMIRQGPIKVGTLGVLQPLADGLKLFIKSVFMFNMKSFISNLIIILIPIILTSIFVFVYIMFNQSLYLIFMFPFFATLISVFTYLISNSLPSIFHKISGQRILCMSIGLEFSFFISLFFMLMSEGSNLLGMMFMSSKKMNSLLPLMILFCMLYLMYIILEGARVPFDHLEAESELVSGFNTEYSGLSFAIIFVGENALLLTWIMILGFIFMSFMSKFMPLLLIMFLMILTFIRGALPRVIISKVMIFSFLIISCMVFPMLFMFYFY